MVVGGGGDGGEELLSLVDGWVVIQVGRGLNDACWLFGGAAAAATRRCCRFVFSACSSGDTVAANAIRRTVGFMPHFESLGRGAWHAAAVAAGVRLIDPSGDPAAIIAAIAGCRVLLSEALHGAIVSDALRVPWIALRPLVPVHRAKWHDWAASLKLRIAFHRLAASSLPECLHASPIAACRSGRTLLDRSAGSLYGVARGRLSTGQRVHWPGRGWQRRNCRMRRISTAVRRGCWIGSTRCGAIRSASHEDAPRG